MYSEEYIKKKVESLYQSHPNIHMSVSLNKPSVQIENMEAKIIGIYRHIFQVEYHKNGNVERHSIQYRDIMAEIVKIEELKLN